MTRMRLLGLVALAAVIATIFVCSVVEAVTPRGSGPAGFGSPRPTRTPYQTPGGYAGQTVPV